VQNRYFGDCILTRRMADAQSDRPHQKKFKYDRLELLLHAHDGATTPTMVSTVAVPGSGSSGMCLVVTDLTLERPGDAQRRLRVVAQMRQATERGASLSRKLLAFSRRQPLDNALNELLAQSS
jgi:hypothetical protein